MIRVENLTKKFGSFQAVNDISFELNAGEILGFLGPNGAGKSTTMKIIAGFLPPTSGKVTVCDLDVVQNSLKTRAKIGYLPETSAYYSEMRIEEFLQFIAEVRGFSGQDKQKRVDYALEVTSLQDVRLQLCETLSKGYRQRVCLAQALLADPSVLILDEPTDGLDPNQKHEVRQLIQRMSEKRSILVSTHILEEVEAVCTRAIIINQGSLVAQGSPEELLTRSRYHGAVSLLLPPQPVESLLPKIKQIDHVLEIEQKQEGEGVRVTVFPKSHQNSILSEIQKLIEQEGIALQQIHVEKGRLDEVFRNVTFNH